MEVCQNCGMYMKPVKFTGEVQEGKEATCEFCGKAIAVIEKRTDGKFYWKKLLPSQK